MEKENAERWENTYRNNPRIERTKGSCNIF